MSKFLPREIPVNAERVIALGASPNFVQIESGRVIDISKITQLNFEAVVGDFYVEMGGLKIFMNEDQFNEMFWVPCLKDRLDNIETLVDSFDISVNGPLTICVLSVSGGRKVQGHCTRYTEDLCTQEEAEHIAYANAIAKLMQLEAHVVQGQVNKVNA